MKVKGPRLGILVVLLLLPAVAILFTRQLRAGNYLLASTYKLVYLTPILYRRLLDGKTLRRSLFEGFAPEGLGRRAPVLLWLGAGLAAVYVLAFLVEGSNADAVREHLSRAAGITATNIVAVSVYIVVANSLLEEFFWRGFLYKELRALTAPWVAHACTGMAFSLHHIMYYHAWLGLASAAAATAGLVAFAVLMNVLFQRTQDLTSVWLVHGVADLGQLVVALYVFGVM